MSKMSVQIMLLDGKLAAWFGDRPATLEQCAARIVELEKALNAALSVWDADYRDHKDVREAHEIVCAALSLDRHV